MTQILDFKKKEPSKQDQINGRIYFELNNHQLMLGRLQRQILGLAKLLGADAKELARMWSDNANMKDFYEDMKEEEDKLIEEENAKKKQQADQATGGTPGQSDTASIQEPV